MAYRITRGTVAKPVKAVVYGVEGVGKTMFASQWPGAVFIDVEDGSGHYDVARLPRPTEWLGLIAEVEAAAKMDEVGTLVIDTVDAAEALCTAHVLTVKKWKGIEDAGYGKGYTYLAEEFGKLLDALDAVVAAGKNVLVVAHAQIKRFAAPDEMGEYDRWELKLAKKDAPLVKEWCDLLLFANFKNDVVVSQDGKTVKASGGKKRVMHAAHAAAFDAKNRLGLPDEMPFEFEAIAGKVPTGVRAEAPADEEEARKGAEAASDALGKLADMTAYAAKVADGDKDATPPEFVEVTEPEIRQLHQLMADYQVNEAQLRTVVGEMGNNPYEETTPIADYSMKFVKNLLKHWESIAEKAKKASDVYGEDIPF